MATQIVSGQLLRVVDPKQLVTTEEFRQMPLCIDPSKALAENKDRPPLQGSTDIQEIRLYLDGRLGRIWKQGEIIFELYLPEDYPLETTIWEVNGEIVCIEEGRLRLLDRMQHLNMDIIYTKNEIARERLASLS